MITFLKIFLSAVWVFMVYMVVATSLESSLLKNGITSEVFLDARHPLGFYANILVIYLWVLYKEKNIAMKLLWLVLFFSLGSIGSIGYVLIELFRLKEGEGIAELLQPKASPKHS